MRAFIHKPLGFSHWVGGIAFPMEILNLGEAGHSPFPKRAKSAVLGVAVIATIVALSSTLAANININSGPIEFGQGVAQTVFCGDGEVPITVTPTSSFSIYGTSATTTEISASSNWLELASNAGIAVGMVADDGGVNLPDAGTVVTGLGSSGWVLLSDAPHDLAGDGTPFVTSQAVTFTASGGTSGTFTPTASGNGSLPVYGWFDIETSGLAVGMHVSGDGVPPGALIVYLDSTPGHGYIQISQNLNFRNDNETPLVFTTNEGGSFALTDITFSNIPDSCNGKVFSVKIYDDTNSMPLLLDGTSPMEFNNESGSSVGDTNFDVWWANSYTTPLGGTTDADYAMFHFQQAEIFTDSYNLDEWGPIIETAATSGSDMASGAFKFILPAPIDTSRVYKITVKTQDDSENFVEYGYAGEGPTTTSFAQFWNDNIN
ncbi:MAG: hypothetical protein F2704_06095 [Actinobacteria bacterium]|uniref:Unannotated protein n=2 Tax=freshwater metagenome TaxID=449393 RepID=A0A6J7U1K1_9ZZZZ|nr:hypothetical protein [Actinomycetota bacterium]MSX24953.1 hypothetical protein [Actinomycetota bacterium]MSY46263.1 hypothetical protein [Actinomycetota bacterium]MSY57811.1 hypothetical protein [Actinomycetota bacterium]MTB00687.1 hypothetical protein [Actinomycetota bacterium]